MIVPLWWVAVFTSITVGAAYGEEKPPVKDYMAEMCRGSNLASSDMCAGHAALQIAYRCGFRTDAILSPAQYLAMAECEEAAAKKAPAKVAESLLKFAQDNRRHAKPGVVLGMTTEQVINETSWGKPARRNTTTTASGTREQWVYYNQYLYFENGVLVSIQQER